ncbi:MAG: ribulose-phosphate 3-epimerase [Gemmatimonadaceae bacterium]|nr:ribulose-phosphate 3-epimerase [Gemmatimonadaceae bacterium]
MSPASAVRIAPSLLSADFGRLAEQLAIIEQGGADWLHVDVMDGVFVPNLTFGAKVIETCRRLTRLPLDVHLMVVEPEKYFDSFAAAGASNLTIHFEAAPHLHRQLARIREFGCNAGVAINPGTPVEHVRDVVRDLDLLLVMTVNPGFGGQKFIESTVGKIARARALLDDAGSGAHLEVDGGISRETINRCWQAGANAFVAGAAVYTAPDPAEEVRALRGRCGVQV